MRTGIEIEVTEPDVKRLEAIVAARGSAQKHVWRARIILLTAQGLGTQAIMVATGKIAARDPDEGISGGKRRSKIAAPNGSYLQVAPRNRLLRFGTKDNIKYQQKYIS